jgi:nucleoside-diphosphate-sugar epimerase
MSKKRVYLLTGASGFIGSCLLRKLVAKNEKVHVLLRKEAKLWRIRDLLKKIEIHFDDLADANKLSNLTGKIRPDIIYHLATYGAYSTQNNGDLCIDTNIRGTWNLLKATAKIDYELFVNTGSSSEYGFKQAPMKENDFLEPASYYAVTKSSQTLLCSYFARENKKPIVTLRPFSVYGPYEEKNRFIPVLMKSIYLQQKMSLVSPDITRDWIYIDDMVDAYLLTDKLKKCGGEVFNIGTAIQSSIREVVTIATKVIGKTTHFEWGKMTNRKWDTSYWVADRSKAKKLLKWSPKISLRQGLLLTWDWFTKNSGYYS